jgi:hypothetical protein
MGKLGDPAFLPVFITFKAAELRRQEEKGQEVSSRASEVISHHYPRSMSMASSRRGQGF